jgi:tungstate transport system ATP-binding protein
VEVDYSDRAGMLSLRRRVGYLMQNPYLFNMSVRDNIGYGLKVRGRPGEEIRSRTDSVMTRLSLSHLARRSAHRLSGGEAQRVALARTLVLDCDVVLLDEPTANVDRRNVRAVEETVRQVNREKNTTVILTTHSQDQAYRMSSDILSIFNGRIRGVAYENVFEGTVLEGSGGVRAVRLAEGLSFSIGSGSPGERVTVAIDPEDILLSGARLSSSALNAFRGTITKAEETGGALRVFADVGVTLCALVTRKSFVEMNLHVGDPVWATFKANAVKRL